MGAMWLLLVLPVANLLGTFAAGFLSRHVATPRIVVWGFGLSALLFALMAASGLPAVAVLAFLAMGGVAGSLWGLAGLSMVICMFEVIVAGFDF